MDDRLQSDILFFFEQNGHPEALPLYEAVQAAALVMDDFGPVTIKVSKTQISFYNRRLFACASFARVKKAKELPIAVATEPYPRRWTHHLVIGSPAEVDAEFKDWLRQAATFAAGK